MSDTYGPEVTFLCPLEVNRRGAAVRDWCRQGRVFWRGQHASGASAQAVGFGLAQMMRQVLQSVFYRAQADVAAQPGGAPVAALGTMGGLGRQELAPYSDLDIVLVAPHCDAPSVRALADAVLYPLWDARLEVGHAVRTPEQFADLVVQDDTVRTSAVDFAAVAGDAPLIAELRGRLHVALGSDATRRYALAAARAWQNESHAGTIYKLQPDIKLGPGGLREIHRLWWLGRLLFKVEHWRDFLLRGLVDDEGFAVLATGRAFLSNIRLAMHFAAQRRQDQLRFDLQDDVAAALHIAAGPAQRSAADNLLQHFYCHAKAVRAVSAQILARCAERLEPPRRSVTKRKLEGFDLFDNQLTLRHVDQFERNPVDVLRILRVAQRYGVPLLPHARTCIRKAAPQHIDAVLRTHLQATRLFVQMLIDPADGGATLETLHDTGVLEHFMPEFLPIIGLTQRDMYHVHTVDAHLVACACLALRMLGQHFHSVRQQPQSAQPNDTSQPPGDLQAMVARVARPHVLVLAALLHDVGKGYGHGHSERGAHMAQVACTRLHLTADDTQDVVWLVLEHLTLFRISQRRDLEDEALILRLAHNVATRERLELLTLLSYVDAQSTGPLAWSNWKHLLLRELFNKTSHVLATGIGAASLAEKAAARLQAVQALAPEPWKFAAEVGRMTCKHLAAHRPALLLRHLQALQAAQTNGTQIGIQLDTARQMSELVIVGRDRAGLLADLCAVFAAWGINIESAHIGCTSDGWAVDTFVFGDYPNIVQPPERYQKFVRELKEAVATQQPPHVRLAERRRPETMARSGAPRITTRILFDVDAVQDATVIDIFTADRVAMLHDLAQALFWVGATIVQARISTQAEQAIDAFYLISSQTQGCLDQAQRLAVYNAVLAVTGPC